jgi:hypothetical protein
MGQTWKQLVYIDDDNGACSSLVELLDADNEGYVDGYEDWEVYSAGKGQDLRERFMRRFY